jgi:hypothetical protein
MGISHHPSQLVTFLGDKDFDALSHGFRLVLLVFVANRIRSHPPVESTARLFDLSPLASSD